MPAAPNTDCTSEPQSQESGPAVPGAYGLPSVFIAALTADSVSAGRTSSDDGWRGSWAAPGCTQAPEAATGTRPPGSPPGVFRSCAAGGATTPAAVSWSTYICQLAAVRVLTSTCSF